MTQRSDQNNLNLSTVVLNQNKILEEQHNLLKEHHQSVHQLLREKSKDTKVEDIKQELQSQNKEFQNTF